MVDAGLKYASASITAHYSYRCFTDVELTHDFILAWVSSASAVLVRRCSRGEQRYSRHRHKGVIRMATAPSTAFTTQLNSRGFHRRGVDEQPPMLCDHGKNDGLMLFESANRAHMRALHPATSAARIGANLREVLYLLRRPSPSRCLVWIR